MPNFLKDFFSKKKADGKFKRAGPGQQLGDASSAAASDAERLRRLQLENQQRQQAEGQPRAGPSAPQQQAAQAALARLESSKVEDFEKKRSQAVIRAQAKKELEREKANQSQAEKLRNTYAEKPTLELEAAPACKGVFFKCELLGDEVLPKAEMKARIKEFLYAQLADEKGLAACLIIHTLAKDADRAKACVDILCKYIDNILHNPNEEKYRKIRKTNKAYVERVAAVEGSTQFLEAAGFETMNIDEEEYWVLSTDQVNDEQLDMLRGLKDALLTSEPIRAELDRQVTVLRPTQALEKISLPPEFYKRNIEEIKKEQQARIDIAEREGMLRTRAMREREEQQEKRNYRYTLIRVRFPNGTILQATFSVYEPYRQLHDLISESLDTQLPFVLYDGGRRLENTDYDTSLVDLKLVPSAILTFDWHPEVANEIKSQLSPDTKYLRQDLLAMLE